MKKLKDISNVIVILLACAFLIDAFIVLVTNILNFNDYILNTLWHTKREESMRESRLIAGFYLNCKFLFFRLNRFFIFSTQ